jgi:hypothetical protein
VLGNAHWARMLRSRSVAGQPRPPSRNDVATSSCRPRLPRRSAPAIASSPRTIPSSSPASSLAKYYAPGVGVFLEVEPDEQKVRLVSCSFDVRCASLAP